MAAILDFNALLKKMLGQHIFNDIFIKFYDFGHQFHYTTSIEIRYTCILTMIF